MFLSSRCLLWVMRGLSEAKRGRFEGNSEGISRTSPSRCALRKFDNYAPPTVNARCLNKKGPPRASRLLAKRPWFLGYYYITSSRDTSSDKIKRYPEGACASGPCSCNDPTPSHAALLSRTVELQMPHSWFASSISTQSPFYKR